MTTLYGWSSHLMWPAALTHVTDWQWGVPSWEERFPVLGRMLRARALPRSTWPATARLCCPPGLHCCMPACCARKVPHWRRKSSAKLHTVSVTGNAACRFPSVVYLQLLPTQAPIQKITHTITANEYPPKTPGLAAHKQHPLCCPRFMCFGVFCSKVN